MANRKPYGRRKALNQAGFVQMLLNQGAVIPCGGCGKPIEDVTNIRREHLNMLEISRDDSISNQQLWHLHPCAHEKTNGTKATSYGSDAHVLAKAKRLTGETPPRPKRKIQSRPFPQRRKDSP